MTEATVVKQWLKRAKSNLERAKTGRVVEEILYEDLCFDCQQSTEKALKALLIFNDITFPKTHSVARLLELLESGGISIPEEVTEAVTLTDYAVTTRYPGVYDDVQESEYQESLVLVLSQSIIFG